jgi:hypothetical protein
MQESHHNNFELLPSQRKLRFHENKKITVALPPGEKNQGLLHAACLYTASPLSDSSTQ